MSKQQWPYGQLAPLANPNWVMRHVSFERILKRILKALFKLDKKSDCIADFQSLVPLNEFKKITNPIYGSLLATILIIRLLVSYAFEIEPHDLEEEKENGELSVLKWGENYFSELLTPIICDVLNDNVISEKYDFKSKAFHSILEDSLSISLGMQLVDEAKNNYLTQLIAIYYSGLSKADKKNWTIKNFRTPWEFQAFKVLDKYSSRVFPEKTGKKIHELAERKAMRIFASSSLEARTCLRVLPVYNAALFKICPYIILISTAISAYYGGFDILNGVNMVAYLALKKFIPSLSKLNMKSNREEAKIVIDEIVKQALVTNEYIVYKLKVEQEDSDAIDESKNKSGERKSDQKNPDVSDLDEAEKSEHKSSNVGDPGKKSMANRSSLILFSAGNAAPERLRKVIKRVRAKKMKGTQRDISSEIISIEIKEKNEILPAGYRRIKTGQIIHFGPPSEIPSTREGGDTAKAAQSILDSVNLRIYSMSAKYRKIDSGHVTLFYKAKPGEKTRKAGRLGLTQLKIQIPGRLHEDTVYDVTCYSPRGFH